jgi:hypothetical protein
VTRREAIHALIDWIATIVTLLIGIALLAVFLGEEPDPDPHDVVIRVESPDAAACPWTWPLPEPLSEGALP